MARKTIAGLGAASVGDLLLSTLFEGQKASSLQSKKFTGSQVATIMRLALDSVYATIASPTFTGVPAAPTASLGTNTTQLATTAFVKAAVDALIASAPGALDTLDELAAALGDDANFAATVTTALAGKQPLDADLTAIAALTSAADKVPYATGTGAWALADLTSVARTLLAQTTQALMRSTGLGLGTAATSNTGDFDAAGAAAAAQAAAQAASQPVDATLTLLSGKTVSYVLAESAAPITAPADTNENTLLDITIPGGSEGANGMLELWFMFTITGSTNTKTLKAYLGGLAGTLFYNVAIATGTIVTLTGVLRIHNRNAQNSQIGQPPAFTTGIGATTAAFTTSSIDTSADHHLLLTGQKASGGETIVLEAYQLKVVKKA